MYIYMYYEEKRLINIVRLRKMYFTTNLKRMPERKAFHSISVILKYFFYFLMRYLIYNYIKYLFFIINFIFLKKKSRDHSIINKKMLKRSCSW